MAKYTWARRGGYEVSTKGDKRFSALNAVMPDGRTIEQWYQCDIKGHQPGGTNWRLGKGKPPVHPMSQEKQWNAYLALWVIWSAANTGLLLELADAAAEKNYVLSDCFASTEINQARALAEILNHIRQ